MSGDLLQVIKDVCSKGIKEEGESTSQDESASDDDVKTIVVPEQLWKCLRLDIADKALLSKLMTDPQLSLTATQLADVGAAALALSSRRNSGKLHPASRTEYSAFFTFTPPPGVETAEWTCSMSYNDCSWYCPSHPVFAE